MDLTSIILHDFCRKERRRQELSQTELGEKCGLTLYRIHSLEAGTGVVTLEEALRILKALGYETMLDGNAATAELIGKALRRKRLYLDLTLHKVAAWAGISKGTVRKAELGEPVRFENAEFIMIAVDVRPVLRNMNSPKKTGDLKTICKEIRRSEGLTQKELADKSYVSWQTVQQFEHGDICPRIDTCEAIFNALGYRIAIEAME